MFVNGFVPIKLSNSLSASSCENFKECAMILSSNSPTDWISNKPATVAAEPANVAYSE